MSCAVGVYAKEEETQYTQEITPWESQLRRRKRGATHILSSTRGVTFSSFGDETTGLQKASEYHDEGRVGTG
jgi:hypothetical protein